MRVPSNRHPSSNDACLELAALIAAIPPARRPAVMQCVASFRPCDRIEQSFAVGRLRAAFARVWETHCQKSPPVEQLRAALDPPLPIGTVLCFSKLMLVADRGETETALVGNRHGFWSSVARIFT